MDADGMRPLRCFRFVSSWGKKKWMRWSNICFELIRNIDG